MWFVSAAPPPRLLSRSYPLFSAAVAPASPGMRCIRAPGCNNKSQPPERIRQSAEILRARKSLRLSDLRSGDFEFGRAHNARDQEKGRNAGESSAGTGICRETADFPPRTRP